MFRGRREYSERLDRIEAGFREQARALEQTRLEIQATRDAIAGAISEARDAANVNGEALRSWLAGAAASLASGDALERTRVSIAEINGRVEAVEKAAAGLSLSLGQCGTEMAALRSELSEMTAVA